MFKRATICVLFSLFLLGCIQSASEPAVPPDATASATAVPAAVGVVPGGTIKEGSKVLEERVGLAVDDAKVRALIREEGLPSCARVREKIEGAFYVESDGDVRPNYQKLMETRSVFAEAETGESWTSTKWFMHSGQQTHCRFGDRNDENKEDVFCALEEHSCSRLEKQGVVDGYPVYHVRTRWRVLEKNQDSEKHAFYDSYNMTLELVSCDDTFDVYGKKEECTLGMRLPQLK